MFGSILNGNRASGVCGTCDGRKVLSVAVLDWRGRHYKSLQEIKCDVCDGKGRVATAADAVGDYESKLQS